MRQLIGKCAAYFLAGFCALLAVGWWKGRHDATANLDDLQVKRVIFENIELRRVNLDNNLFLAYTCDGKPIYTIDLDTHQSASLEKVSSSDGMFKPALIVPASEVTLWALGSASGFTLIEKGKLLFTESVAESPSWRTLSFVVGAISGYTAGYWLGTRGHPKCLSAQVIKHLESPDACRAIQNDVFRALLLDMFVIVDDDSKNPIPLLSAVKEINSYSQRHPEAKLNRVTTGFFVMYLLLDQMKRKDWLSDSSSFDQAARVRELMEGLFKSPSADLMEVFGAHKSLRITKTYDLMHDSAFVAAYRSRQK